MDGQQLFLMSHVILFCSDLAEHSLGIKTYQLAKKHVDKVITVRYCLGPHILTRGSI